MDHGIYTAKLGKELYDNIKDPRYQIYYDHGDKKKGTHTEHTCEPTPFFNECHDDTTLGNTDIVIIKTGEPKGKVMLVVEIEECGSSPKKVIGDIGSILLSEKMRINGPDYEYESKLIFILGLKVEDKGAGRAKAKNICEKYKEIIKKNYEDRITLIPKFEDDLETLIDKIRTEIYNQLEIPEPVV